jgi:putative phosphoribosyl transferase
VQDRREEVLIPAGGVRLAGDLTLPSAAPGVVLFAHGSGSGLALTALGSPSRLCVVPRATHLFEEPGTLEQVATLASDWCQGWLARPQGA